MNKLSCFYSFLFLCLLTFIASPRSCFAQRIEGRIFSENGEGLAFATVHQKYTTYGTTSNANGFYSLELQNDTATVVFQYVGYQTIEKIVSGGNSILKVDVHMIPDLVELEAVVVKPGLEDPAYAIIRKTIQNRQKHLREARDYRCEVYIKGMQRLDQVPEKILGIPVAVDTGIVYLSESVSQLSFEQPDKIKERIISSKVSGDNQAFSFNQASDILINFYENLIHSDGLSERSFVSPIADNALSFYEFELLGTTYEDGRTLNKIRVIPKRGHDPTFSGQVYIIEDLWRLHSLDLLLTKEHQIEFVDSLKIRQVLAPVDTNQDEVWMILTQQFDFQLNAFGFKGKGHFVGVYRDYSVNQGFQKKHFNNEIVRVEPKSNQKDSSYWSLTRPIPLTLDEVQDYRLKDSLRLVKDSKPYRDSVDRKSNKITPVNILVTGKTIRNSFKQQSWNFPPLVQMLQYNTVEGFTTNLSVRYTKRYDDFKYYRINPELRYGFGNERFNARINLRYYYEPLKFASIELGGGRFVEQLNESSPLEPFDNTVYTLIAGENYLKIYEKLYVNLKHEFEITNGFYLSGLLEWSQRNPLVNTSDYSFNDRAEKEFTPNAPENEDLGDTSFEKHQAFIIEAELKWQPGQEYIRRPYRKFITSTRYPAITLRFKAAVDGLFGSDLDYQRVSADISHDFKAGLLGTGLLKFGLGGFIGKDSLSFIDFQHFNGNRTIFGHFRVGNYQLLDYYRYSTRNVFYKGHYEHHFNGFILNKVPLIRKTKVQAVAAINYLHTEEGKSYWELGVGIEHILKILRVDYFNSWRSGLHQRSGIRIGVGF